MTIRRIDLRGGHHRFTRSQGRENCTVCHTRTGLTLIHTERPAAVVRLDGTLRLFMLRGAVRDMLVRLGIQFVEVSPQHLKQFATGRASHPASEGKGPMMYACSSRIRAAGGTVMPRNDDEADAWHLRRMGRVG